MNSFDAQQQESLKRRWQERSLPAIDELQIHNRSMSTPSNSFFTRLVSAPPTPPFMNSPRNLQRFPGGIFDEDPGVMPAVTVVLEGRSICQRISLHKHTNYQSLAKALRHMFVDTGEDSGTGSAVSEDDLDLSNAIPGHLIAYEDMENDLLLVGDLNWKDFVRVAKRIRILPVKSNSRKGRIEK